MQDQAHNPNPSALPRWVAVVLLLGLVAAAAALRLPRLGALGFEVDEGYQLKGVGGILAHGVPRLETGHAYTRSPAFLYLQAWCASVWGLTPFALRLPAAVFGVLCVPVGYWFGRRLVGPAVGWSLAVMLAVSGFHVELSRYGRFYTLFQLTFMLAVLAFYFGYMRWGRGVALRRGAGWWKAAFWGLTLFALTLHDTAVILGLCFLPLVVAGGYTAAQRAWLLVEAAIVGAAWVGYRQALGAWTAALSDPSLQVVKRATADRLQESAPAGRLTNFIPDVALPTFDYFRALVLYHPRWLIPLTTVFVVALGAVGWLARRRSSGIGPSGGGWEGGRERRRAGPALLGVLILAAAMTQQGVIAVLLGALYLAWYVRRRADVTRPLPLVVFGGALLILAMHAAVNVKVMHYGRARGVLYLFSFPDWNRYLLSWLWRGWPLILLAMPFGLAALAGKSRDERGRAAGPWLLIGLLLLGMSLGGVAEGKFNEARYFFQLYPIVLITFAAALLALGGVIARPLRGGPGRGAVLAAVVAVGLFSTADLNVIHTRDIHQRQYGEARSPVRSVYNLYRFAGFHQDLETVGRYVAEHRRPGDAVLVVGPPPRGVVLSFYADGIDYHVAPPGVITVKSVDDAGRWHDPVTGAELIDDAVRLRAVVEEVAAREGGGGRLWVINNDLMADPMLYFLPESVMDAVFALTPTREVTGRDGSSFVGLVPPAATVEDR